MRKNLCGETAAIFVRRAFYFVVYLNLRIFRNCEFNSYKQNICILVFCFKTIQLTFFEEFLDFWIFSQFLKFSNGVTPLPLMPQWYNSVDFFYFWYVENQFFNIFSHSCNATIPILFGYFCGEKIRLFLALSSVSGRLL